MLFLLYRNLLRQRQRLERQYIACCLTSSVANFAPDFGVDHVPEAGRAADDRGAAVVFFGEVATFLTGLAAPVVLEVGVFPAATALAVLVAVPVVPAVVTLSLSTMIQRRYSTDVLRFYNA